MSVELRPVTAENWRALIKLQVREDQREFVASNLHSIAEAQFGYEEEGHWNFYPFGVYANEEPVGFLMHCINYKHSRFQGFIVRLMVDEHYQGKGYGRAAMEQILETFRADERVHQIGISYEPHNKVAQALYASLGFVEPGEMAREETLAILKLR